MLSFCVSSHSIQFTSIQLNPLGLITPEKGQQLDQTVGPTPMTTGPSGDVALLRAEAVFLNADPAVKEAILADLEPVRLSHILIQ